jgi:hypothetical protein
LISAPPRLRVKEGRFGDAEEWRSIGGLAAAVDYLLVLFHEAEMIDLLVDEEVGGVICREVDRGIYHGVLLSQPTTRRV